MVVVQLTSSRFIGSVERQMLGLASELPRNYRSVFVSFSEGGTCRDFLAEAESQGFQAIGLASDTPRLFGALNELTMLLRQLRADVVCGHGYKADILGQLACRRLGIPMLAVCHGWTGENLKVRAYEALDRRAMGRMDAIVCVSQAQAEKTRRLGVGTKRLVVIPDAVRPERFSHPDRHYAQLARSFFSRQPDRLVGAAGRLSPEKGFADLVEAAALVARSDPSVGFVLFGDGPLREALSHQIANRGLQSTFHLAGFRTDLDRFLPHFNLTVLPSYTEGLPNIVLESFAAGVPVVATAVGGTPEIIEHGINGYLVEPRRPEQLASCILQALRAGDASRQMGSSGRQKVVSKFNFEAQARAYDQLFRDLMERRHIKEPRAPVADPSLKHDTDKATQAAIPTKNGASSTSPGEFHGPGAARHRQMLGCQTPATASARRAVRVCFMIDRLNTAGTESQLIKLIGQLDRTRVKPHLCLLDGNDGESQALEPENCPVLRLGVRSLHHPTTVAKSLRLAEFLRRRKIDVLQLYFADSTYLGALVGRIAGVRFLVGTRFDLGYWMRPVDRYLGRFYNHLLDRTVVNCEACLLAAIEHQGRLPHPVTVVENGVSLDAFAHDTFAGRAREGCNVGMVANLRSVKNPGLLIEAASLLRAAHPDLQFSVAGEGDLRPKLLQAIQRLGLAGQFRLRGRVTDVPGYLSTLDIAVLCSWSEGMPNAVLEYMAAGRAIIATAVGGTGQLIDHDVHGLLVPPGDAPAMAAAIDRLARDPELRARLGTAARRRVGERYSQETRVLRFEALYEELVHGTAIKNLRPRRAGGSRRPSTFNAPSHGRFLVPSEPDSFVLQP